MADYQVVSLRNSVYPKHHTSCVIRKNDGTNFQKVIMMKEITSESCENSAEKRCTQEVWNKETIMSHTQNSLETCLDLLNTTIA